MKPEDKGGGDDKTPSPQEKKKEPVPELKIFPSEKVSRRKSVMSGDLPWKEKRSSADSVHHKVSRTNSQTKRRVSPSETMPKRCLSTSDPRFQKRISLTEFPGSRKISPCGSPTYQKLGSIETNGQQKHYTRRKTFAKAVTLTDDPTYHRDLSPSPCYLRKFFPENSLTVDDDAFSSESLSPNQTPKYFSAEAVTPARTPSRESLKVFPEIVFDLPKVKISSSCRGDKPSLSGYISPSETAIHDIVKKSKVTSSTETQPLLSKNTVVSEKPSHICRQLSHSSESQSSSLKVTPQIPLAITLDRLGALDSLPQLIRRASCKPAPPIDTGILISLLSKTGSQEKRLPPPPLSRQQNLPTEPSPIVYHHTKTKENKKYERLK